MPKSVSIDCNHGVRRIHLLGCVAGWGFQGPFPGANNNQSVSIIVSLHYENGEVEKHELLNGVHICDFLNSTVNVAKSRPTKLAGRQVRYLSISPKISGIIKKIELSKGEGDITSPVIVGVTVEESLSKEDFNLLFK